MLEDDDRLVLSKDILVQSESTYNYDELKFIQKSNNTICTIYIKEYLPTANLRLDEITHSDKNLIITEGKTDWKHLKNALIGFKMQNKYKNLDFEFFEYEDDVPMCNSTLLNICKYQSLFKNEHIKVFIFDSDDPFINKEHEDNVFKYYGNNVYSLVLPVPKHRQSTPFISIENYYTDDEIKTYDANGRRLYLAKEFDKRTCRHLKDYNLYALDVKKDIEGNHILDNKVYRIDGTSDLLLKKDIFAYFNKHNVALSKNNFATYILKKIKPFDKISISNFSIVFDALTQIQKDSLSKTNLIKISDGVYLEDYISKKVLHINFVLENKHALEFKNSNILKCAPIVSKNKKTLFLSFNVKTFSFKIPISISNTLIDLLRLQALQKNLRNSYREFFVTTSLSIPCLKRLSFIYDMLPHKLS